LQGVTNRRQARAPRLQCFHARVPRAEPCG
jgi:hypothetical protein